MAALVTPIITRVLDEALHLEEHRGEKNENDQVPNWMRERACSCPESGSRCYGAGGGWLGDHEKRGRSGDAAAVRQRGTGGPSSGNRRRQHEILERPAKVQVSRSLCALSTEAGQNPQGPPAPGRRVPAGAAERRDLGC